METTTLEVKKSEKLITMADVVKDRRWQILMILSAAALVFVFMETFRWWWAVWNSEESEYSHGILIPFMSAFAVWFNRKRIATMRPEPSMWGLAFVLPAILIHFAADRNAIPSVAGLMLPIILIGASMITFGKRITWQLLFPILFLYFMTVPPTSILSRVSFEIQLASTKLATLGLNLIGIETQRDGVMTQMPNIRVQVAGACSGFRTLIALLAFSSFLAYMKLGPLWGRISLVGLVFPLGLIANSIRVLLVSLVGDSYGEDAMHVFHDYAGILVLVVVLPLLFMLAKVVKCPDFKSMPQS